MNEKTINFNWALLLGLCVVAISIYLTGSLIAGQMPHSLHGHFSGTLMDGGRGVSDQEFMSEWAAAHFVGLSHEEFAVIVESGELAGTYTVFQIERMVMIRRGEYERYVVADGVAEMPVRIEYDTIVVDHRVFSRERLAEWLLGRMDGR